MSCDLPLRAHPDSSEQHLLHWGVRQAERGCFDRGRRLDSGPAGGCPQVVRRLFAGRFAGGGGVLPEAAPDGSAAGFSAGRKNSRGGEKNEGKLG